MTKRNIFIRDDGDPFHLMAKAQRSQATGRRGMVSGVFIVEVDDGRIVSEHSYWDQIALLTQLGLMPAI